MRLGIVGLGRMGANIARRLMAAGHACVVHDADPKPGAALAAEGAMAVADLAALVAALEAPRAVWVMLPAGAPTQMTIDLLAGLLSPGDTIIDGGNSFWKDDIRRAKALAARDISYLDVGTSGGVFGLTRGFCLMIGGPEAAYARLEPIFFALAPGEAAAPATPGRDDARSTAHRGYLHCGPNGAGHYVKMIHNGVEYGMMQALAEGLDLMAGAQGSELPEDFRLELDLAEIAELWRRGSVVSSWLVDLTAQALAADPALSGYSGHVSDSGEGRWTVDAAVEQGTPAPVLTAALFARFRSRQRETFADKSLSAMRKGFGGHLEQPKKG